MRIIRHPRAQMELEQQLLWLKKHGLQINSPELFFHEIQAALEELRARTHHREMAETPGYFRLGPTPIFSYSLVYKIHDDEIHLLAIASPHRRPRYWKRRSI
jgi:hypothetical protein